MRSSRTLLPLLACWCLLSSLLLPQTGSAQGLDQYGGYVALPAPGGATGYFRVKKIGPRWVLVTPLGNVFWMRGVQNVSPARDSTLKYPTTQAWANTTTKRMQAWGFNAVHIFSNTHAFPPSVGGDAGNISFPFTINMWPTRYGLLNQDLGLGGPPPPGPFKDLIQGLNSTYTGWRGSQSGDFFDPAFDTYVNWQAQGFLANAEWGPRLLSPWNLGMTTDETDGLFGVGPPPETAGPNGVTHPHIGWLTIATAPTQTSSVKWGQTYTDTTVYSKQHLKTQLQAKYGTIGALNSAWGSNYTTWDSAGGYGVGTGFMDEDGRHTAWLGAVDGNLVGVPAAVKTDLDIFLYDYFKKYGTVLRTRLKQAFPNHLVWGPPSVNSHFGVSRPKVLQALAETMDIVSLNATNQAYFDLTVQAMGDVPMFTWEGLIANPDSALFATPNIPLYPHAYTTQAARGQGYAGRVAFLLNTKSLAGNYPFVGLALWEWHDNPGEKTNWGLVSFRENAYDGVESVAAIGTDPQGFPTGGEARNYGNFLSSVIAAHSTILTTLQEALGAYVVAPPAPPTNLRVQ